MNSIDQKSSLFLIVLSLIVILGAVQLGLGDLHKPGPGFFPFLAGVILMISSVAVWVKGLRSKEEPPEQARILGKKLILVILALLSYFWLFKILGFIVCTALLMGFLLYIYEPRKWWIIGVEVAFSVFLLYLVFKWLLNVRFPNGVLGF